jgi:two-component sensor histidine kinase
MPSAALDHRVWALPTDATCARTARDLVGTTLTALLVPREVVRDAKLMISELVTNAYQHASGHVPHELWLDWHADEVVCAVFDTLPMDELAADLAFSGDFGRGLSIVADLSEGRWGLRIDCSRLRPNSSGKSVWFACKVLPDS